MQKGIIPKVEVEDRISIIYYASLWLNFCAYAIFYTKKVAIGLIIRLKQLNSY